MKQFNLQEYLASPNRQVVMRNGRNVRIVCTDFNNPDFPVIGEIKGYKWPISFTTNGEAIKGKQLCNDLFFAPEKHEGWINIYYDVTPATGCCIHKSAKDAKEAASPDVIATIKIEWEE